MNILQGVNDRCCLAGVVSSYLAPEGTAGGLGPAQSALSNYRLKPPAGVESGASATARPPAAA